MWLWTVIVCSLVFNNSVRGQFLNLDSPIRDAAEILKEYDFVVVGAGSGGSVVANRLTENPAWTVLLLEAGRDEIFLTDVPLTASLLSITGYNWGYKSQKMKTACFASGDNCCNIARGKGLGGTSIVNFMIYSRGNKQDFDTWAEAGNTGWSYQEVLPYFIKSENCTNCRNIDRQYHGTDGYLNVEHAGYESPFVKRFLKAGTDLGYPTTDLNGKRGLGFSRVQANLKGGRRCSASKAFLRPVAHRPNLHISMLSRVTKVLIDPKTKQAYGVEFFKKKRKYVVTVRKEVILSAGSINSPHLLMLSGIGPGKHLEEKKIHVVQDLPVGLNLQDHLSMSALPIFVNESLTVSDLAVQNPRDIFNYLIRGIGPYTIPGGAEALGFIKTNRAPKSQTDYPDIELVLGAGALNGDVYGSFRSLLGFSEKFFRKVYTSYIGRPAFSIAVVLLRPKSIGRVSLKDSNPFHWPVIEPNYLTNEEDVKVLVEGVKTVVAIANSPHFKRYNATILPLPFPNCETLPFNTDKYWTCVLRLAATTLGHQVGTCKMGPREDPTSVVDPELKVHGVSNLRVVDGSIMPHVVAGHTNAAIYMIGEKASDMIKEKWRNS